MAFTINKDTLQAYKPHSLSTLLTVAPAPATTVTATKVTPDVAAGSFGIQIYSILVTQNGADTSVDFYLCHRNTSGGTFKRVSGKLAYDARAVPAQMFAAAVTPGLPLLNSGSPVWDLGEGEELGIEIAGATAADTFNVCVNYRDLFITV
jgi:hypothetical protein